MVSATSAWLREGRLAAPAKITSSMPPARMALAELAPITQRSASNRFDLPQPFGPTTPVTPGSILNSVGSTKDLKPERRNRWKCTGGLTPSLRHGGDDREQDIVHLDGGHRDVFQPLAVDEDRRRGVHTVLFGRALGPGGDSVERRLVAQAGVEPRRVDAVRRADLLQDRLDIAGLPARLAAEHLV